MIELEPWRFWVGNICMFLFGALMYDIHLKIKSRQIKNKVKREDGKCKFNRCL